MSSDDDELVPSLVIAKRLGVAVRTIQNYARRGLLVPDEVLPSGMYRWRWSSVRRQLDEARQRTDDDAPSGDAEGP